LGKKHLKTTFIKKPELRVNFRNFCIWQLKIKILSNFYAKNYDHLLTQLVIIILQKYTPDYG